MRRASQLILSAVVFVLSGVSVFARTPIMNPYAEVNWETYRQHKANLHTHTLQHRVRDDGSIVFVNGLIQAPDGTILQEAEGGYNRRNRHPDFEAAQGRSGGSDGRVTPMAKIDAYRGLGYTILALTDHNMVTWPWQDYGRDPNVLGMLAVQGNEPSRHHHMGSYFNDYDGSARNVEASIQAVGERNGLAVLFHPGRYRESVDWYVNLYEKYDHLVGLEVYNQGDRYPQDRATWDAVLTRLMPQRPVWGMANDDAHGHGHVGRNWQVFLLPELTEEALRRAMIRGHSFFSYAPGGHPRDSGDPAPVIEAIRVNAGAGQIAIEASGYDRVEWISAGRVIADGPVLDASERQGYVRAVLIGETGRTYTQPFFIGDPQEGTPAEE